MFHNRHTGTLTGAANGGNQTAGSASDDDDANMSASFSTIVADGTPNEKEKTGSYEPVSNMASKLL